LVTSWTCLAAETIPPIPQSFPPDRYEPLISKSPFAVATAPVDPGPPAENFSTHWRLTGLMRVRGVDGKTSFIANIGSRDLSVSFTLHGNQPNADKISIDRVEENPVSTKSIVYLKKEVDGRIEGGSVAFDQAVTLPPANPGGAPNAPNGGKLPPATAAPGAKQPANRSIPRPGMTSQPRSGVQTPPANSAPNVTPGAPAAPDATRRRVRTVSDPP
jgi:hypothetical protein